MSGGASFMGFREDNEAERMRFVKLWAEYVRTHDDKDWSRQQNVIIDSALKTANITKKQYLALKEKGGKYVRKRARL